jgi:hypothetical protein
MSYDGFGWGFPHALFLVINGIVALFLFLATVGIVILFVRFLLHATTAAKIYVAKNSTPEPSPSAPVTPVAPSAPADLPTKPATKPRTPKAPPAAPPTA